MIETCASCGAKLRNQTVVEPGRAHNSPCGCEVALERGADR